MPLSCSLTGHPAPIAARSGRPAPADLGRRRAAAAGRRPRAAAGAAAITSAEEPPVGRDGGQDGSLAGDAHPSPRARRSRPALDPAERPPRALVQGLAGTDQREASAAASRQTCSVRVGAAAAGPVPRTGCAACARAGPHRASRGELVPRRSRPDRPVAGLIPAPPRVAGRGGQVAVEQTGTEHGQLSPGSPTGPTRPGRGSGRAHAARARPGERLLLRHPGTAGTGGRCGQGRGPDELGELGGLPGPGQRRERLRRDVHVVLAGPAPAP